MLILGLLQLFFSSEKKREFYKNAKYVNKYKKSIKQQGQGIDHPSARRTPEVR